jgi:hypothetical protein
MSDERVGLPVDWEIVAKGWTGQEVFEFLTREQGLKPSEAVAQMNGRGRALRWQWVRHGAIAYPHMMAPPSFFSNHIWDLTEEGRVTIVPPVPSVNGEIPPPEPIFMAFQDEVRQRWPARENSNAGAPARHAWDNAENILGKLWKERGDPKAPETRGNGWRSDEDLYKEVRARMAKIEQRTDSSYEPPDASTIGKHLRPLIKNLRKNKQY